jgi:hypothetical protein
MGISTTVASGRRIARARMCETPAVLFFIVNVDGMARRAAIRTEDPVPERAGPCPLRIVFAQRFIAAPI